MALPRSPGDTDELIKYRSVKRTFKQSRSGFRSPYTVTENAGETFSIIDRRPTYEKGTLVKLPSGFQFRNSTSYSHESWEMGPSHPATSESRWNGRHYVCEDSGIDSFLFLHSRPVLKGSGIPDSMRNEAITKALNDIGNQKVNVGENLGTAHQTVRLFAGKAGFLAGALLAAKEKELWKQFLDKSARDLGRRGIPEFAAQQYIEYVYGLRPLVQDVFNGYELTKEGFKDPILISGNGHSAREYTKDETPGPASGSATLSRVNWRSSVKVKCRLTATPKDDWLFLRHLNQLGLLNPASLAWELVPWSFLVDWLLPIGPVLAAYSAPAGLDFIDGYISARTRENHIGEYHCTFVGNPESGFERPAQFPISYEGYHREKITRWPRPGLWVDQSPIRGDRSIKAAALAILNLGNQRRNYGTIG